MVVPTNTTIDVNMAQGAAWELQPFEQLNMEIRAKFCLLKTQYPERLARRIDLSWSNWMFGRESLQTSVQRLARAGVSFIELHGNHYGPGQGYEPKETIQILSEHGVAVSGICGMFSMENDLSSPSPQVRQNAIDYIERELEFGEAVKAGYLLVVPGAVGRPNAYDEGEFARSTSALREIGDVFVSHGVKGAIEPIRSAEVSFCHTIAEAKRYIEAVGHPGVQHINGDLYHMQSEESHIGQAILDAGGHLLNLHAADSNRCALGDGFMDLDTVIMALYIIGYNRPGCFLTPEPLGPGGDPYPAMHAGHDPAKLDELVQRSVNHFRHREALVLQM